MGGSSSKLPATVPTEEKGVPPATVPTEENGVPPAYRPTQEEMRKQKEFEEFLDMSLESLGEMVWQKPTTTTQASTQTENISEASPRTTVLYPVPSVDSAGHKGFLSLWPGHGTDSVKLDPYRCAMKDVQESRKQVEDLRAKISSLTEESRAAREDRRQQKRKAEESVQSQLSALQTGLEAIQKNQERVLEALRVEARKRAKLVQVIEERLPEVNNVSEMDDTISELMVIKDHLVEAVMDLKAGVKQDRNKQPAETRTPISDAMVRGHHSLNLNVPTPRYSSPLSVHDGEDARKRLRNVTANPMEASSSKPAPMRTCTTGTPCFRTPISDSRGNTTTASGSASPSSSPESPLPSQDFDGLGDDDSSSPRSPIYLD